MAKVRLFISFDYDHDFSAKTMLAGQAKNPETPFEFADWSVKEPMTGDWKEKVRRRIRSCDQVLVLCGLHTATATGVSEELRITQEEGIPYFLLAAYNGKNCVKPRTARLNDKVYEWTWNNLLLLIKGIR